MKNAIIDANLVVIGIFKSIGSLRSTGSTGHEEVA
jgi:hypothetical protein